MTLVVVSFYHNTMTAKPSVIHLSVTSITIVFDQHIISVSHVHEYQQPLSGTYSLALQAIFLASNEGAEVNEPQNLGFKVFSAFSAANAEATSSTNLEECASERPYQEEEGMSSNVLLSPSIRFESLSELTRSFPNSALNGSSQSTGFLG
jgi:hypothetical protein